MIQLRPYQEKMVEAARRLWALGKRRILMVAPTGAGKTHILANNLWSHTQREPDGVALYVVHRRQLVEQTHGVLERLGMKAAVVMAGYDTDWSANVFVVSRDTWERRKDRINFGRHVGLVVFDEAHIGIGAQKRLVEYLEPGTVLGYTATPVSMSGPGMGDLYESLIGGPTYEELIEMGFLVPTRWVVAQPLDTSGLRVSKMTNDYVTEDVARLVRGQVLGNIYEAWGQYGGERSVVFAPTVDIAATVAARFGAMQVRAAAIDWSTPPRERQRILAGFKEGSIKVIVNVDVMSEGWDEPLVDTIILANPTRSFARHIQRIGRGMRVSAGKQFVKMIDLVGALAEHGQPEDILGWDLEPARPDRKKGTSTGLVKRRGVCPNCKADMTVNPCPQCGFEVRYRPTVSELEILPARFLEGWKKPVPTYEERMVFFLQLLWCARSWGKKDGWAAHMYKERFDEWPPRVWLNAEPIEPGEGVRKYVRGQLMKYAKDKGLWSSSGLLPVKKKAQQGRLID
jgi:superfamily II DNA or RNA helicase